MTNNPHGTLVDHGNKQNYSLETIRDLKDAVTKKVIKVLGNLF